MATPATTRLMTLTPKQAADAGMSQAEFYRATRAGEFTRIARGIYLPTAAAIADWDMLEAATKRADATLCLTSALALHDLTDDIPRALDIAIPRGSRIPAGRSAIAWHLFDRATFDIGRTTISIPGSDMTIGLYSPERTIIDALRLRAHLGYEAGCEALRRWLRRGGNAAALLALAKTLPRAKGPLLRALDALPVITGEHAIDGEEEGATSAVGYSGSMTELSNIDVERLREVCQRYGVLHLDVFGSVARGQAEAGSDIDLLYVLAPDAHLGFGLFDLESELSEIFGRRVDLVARKYLNPLLRDNVIAEAQELYAA